MLQEPGAGVVAASVGRDVAFGPENVRMPRADMAGAVASALAAVGLGDLPLDTPTSALSGGQTQRLALAGTLALDPSVVLLDEPTAMLDPASAQEVRDAVAALTSGEGRPGAGPGPSDRATGHPSPTLVVVEHVLGPWVDLVDRLVVLSSDGRVVADGPVRETLASERDRLLAMGIWVPGAGPPDPLPVDAALVAPRRAGRTASLAAAPLVVERTTRLVDGTARTRGSPCWPIPLVAAPGTLTALVGPSGSGKSTVLHALAGFLEPADPVAVRASPARDPFAHADGVRTDAVPDAVPPASLSAPDLARTLAWVPQWSSSTIVARTVLDEVLTTARTVELTDGAGDGAAESTERARALLLALGLGHLEAADPRQLSGGEQRRLAVAAALHHGPPVLLADEPTVGQDRGTWAAVVGLVAAYREAGGAVVAATHDAHVVDRATRVHHLVAPRGARGAGAGRGAARRPVRPAGTARAAPCSPSPRGCSRRTGRPRLAVLATQFVLAVIGLWAPGGRGGVVARARRVLVRMVPGLVAALSVGWSTWFLAGRDLDPALTVGLRVLVIVLPSAVLIPWIDPDALGDALAQRLRLPDRPVVATVGGAAAGALVRRDLARARPGPPGPGVRGVVARATHAWSPTSAPSRWGCSCARCAPPPTSPSRWTRAASRPRSPARGGCRRRGGGATPSSSCWPPCRSWWRSSPGSAPRHPTDCGSPTFRVAVRHASGG